MLPLMKLSEWQEVANASNGGVVEVHLRNRYLRHERRPGP